MKLGIDISISNRVELVNKDKKTDQPPVLNLHCFSHLSRNRLKAKGQSVDAPKLKTSLNVSVNSRLSLVSRSSSRKEKVQLWKGFNNRSSSVMKKEINDTKLHLNFISPQRIQAIEGYKNANKALFEYRNASNAFKLDLIRKGYQSFRNLQKQKNLPRKKILIMKKKFVEPLMNTLNSELKSANMIIDGKEDHLAPSHMNTKVSKISNILHAGKKSRD